MLFAPSDESPLDGRGLVTAASIPGRRRFVTNPHPHARTHTHIRTYTNANVPYIISAYTLPRTDAHAAHTHTNTMHMRYSSRVVYRPPFHFAFVNYCREARVLYFYDKFFFALVPTCILLQTTAM